MTNTELTLDDYANAIHSSGPPHLKQRIVKQEKQSEDPAIWQFTFDDGAVIKALWNPMPLHQPVWGSWVEYQIDLITPPTHNPHGFQPQTIFQQKLP